MKGPSRLPVVDALRGVAAMAVCWYHVTGGFPSYPTSAPLRASGAEGWLGVAIFLAATAIIVSIPSVRAIRGSSAVESAIPTLP